jgi:hypothetical protein
MNNIADRLFDRRMKTNLLHVIYAVYFICELLCIADVFVLVRCIPQSLVACKEKL